MSANGFGRHPLMPHTRVVVGGPSTQVRAAIRRLYRVTNPIFAAQERRDWVTVADLATSRDDAREALRAAMRDWPAVIAP